MLKKQIILPLTVTLFAPCVEGVTAKEAPQNILFILVDDLGWNDLGFMGSDFHESPNIDRLAESGAIFTDAYAACSVSSPSRASIMSGQYTTHHGVTDWIGEKEGEAWRTMGRHSKLLPAQYRWFIDPSLTLMPELLQESGYTTFMAGKWHLGEQETNLPEQNGFDINKGGWASGSPKGGYFAPYDNPKLEQGADGEDLTMRLAQETSDFIHNHQQDKKSRKQPFFAYLSFYAVHAPLETTERYWSYFRDKAERMGIAEQGFEVDRTLPVRQHQDNPIYAGLIKQMDDAVGIVLDRLEQEGIADNTLVIFTSDNGGVVSGDNYSTSLTPLRGGKGRQFEGGTRVPLIIRDPRAKNMTARIDTPVCGIDFYPTVMNFAGVSIPESVDIDGLDISPLLNGKQIDDRALFWHYPHYGNQGGEPSSTIRRGDWKLIYYHEDQRYELYNLALDITESNHLNIQYPEILEQLREELMSWLDESGAVMPTADMEYDGVKEQGVKQMWSSELLQRLEAQRRAMLQPSYRPNPTWWGSQPEE